METVNDTAMHVTETKTLCSSLTCPKSKSEEITKEKEEELLYGNSEDGDEDDACSDDSMRLRLSDDEADLDEPSASEELSNDKIKPKGTNMELGSDVPAKNISDKESALKTESLQNGKCTVDERNESRVNEDGKSSDDDFASDTLPNTKEFFGVDDSANYCNGTSGQSDKTQTSRFATNSYNDRYYNDKTYYGRGKPRSKGFTADLRSSFSNDSTSDGKYSPRIFPTDALRKEKDVEKPTETSATMIESAKTTDNSAESNSAVPSKINESSEKRESNSRQDKKDISKRDNADKAAAKNVDSIDSTFMEKSVDEVTTPTDSAADKSPNHRANLVDAKSEVDDSINISGGSAETLIADNANDIGENSKEEKSSTELEASLNKSKSKSHNADKGAEDLTGDAASENQAEPITDGTSIETETSEVQKDANAAVVNSSDATEGKTKEVDSAAPIQSKKDQKEAEDKTTEESLNDLPDILPSESQRGPSNEQPERSDDNRSTIVSKEQLNNDESQDAMEESVAMNDGETVEKDIDAANMDSKSQPKISEIEDSIADLPDEKETSSDDESNDNTITVVHSSLKRMSTEILDDMELSKRIRIRRKTSIDQVDGSETKAELVSPNENVPSDEKTDKDNGSVVNPVTNNVADITSDSETSVTSNTVVETFSSRAKAEEEQPTKLENVDSDDNKDCEVIEVPVKRKQKRIRRSLPNVHDSVVSQEDTQEKENVRQKRRTAKNAEEIIRKEFLGNSDSESSDSAGKFVAVNYNKTNNNLRSASPPTLKRNHIDDDEKIEQKIIKKLKQDVEVNGDVKKTETLARDEKLPQTLRHVRTFFRRDANGKLAKLKQEELEELLIQKVVETITMRDEIGKLREQAKISERNQEATRVRCQQLAKQIKDFEMVLNRYHSDRRSNPDKTVVPIKINRSVGLQVNFVTDHGIQNLRQLAQTQKNAAPTMNGISTPLRSDPSPNAGPVVKRTIKTRSPRRPDAVTPTSSSIPTAVPLPVHNQPIIPNVTPAALVVAKNVQDTRPPVTTTVKHTSGPQLLNSNQTILVNGLTNTAVRQATMQMSKTKNNSDLIDLTQEEEKIKTTVIPQNAILTTSLAEATPNVANVSNTGQRYHTVIQTLPGSVTINTPSGIRVVQPTSQPTPTALVNNMNAPRLAYVMQGGIGGPRQVVITSGPTPIRPAPEHPNRPLRASFPISGTITNGTVRVIPTSTTATLQVCKHPAALPESINPPSNPTWKLPPPAPSLKISKVANGIVLSWNMVLNEKFADIASYQLYAYQEVSGVAPSSTLWKKVGDVRALPLPMACTLTQFSEGNNYYFAVRAVDRHSRLGQYSQPGNISL